MPSPAVGPVTARPSMSTRPLEAGSSPATIRSSVVFPQPLGPTMERNRPSSRSNETSSSARRPTRPGNSRVSRSTRRNGVTRSAPRRRRQPPQHEALGDDDGLEDERRQHGDDDEARKVERHAEVLTREEDEVPEAAL